MIAKLFRVSIILFLFLQFSLAQNQWGTQGKYLTKNGKQIYLSGVNYIVSDGWMINLPNLSEQTMEADMAALQGIGVNHVRFFPMWQLTQPTIGKLDEKVMKQLDKMIVAAGNHHISMQIAPITGFMSGAAFLPKWAMGDIFRDRKIIDGQIYLCKTMAQRYKNNPNVLGFDFGNELNVLVGRVGNEQNKKHTPTETLAWMNQIYPAFKNASPNQLVTNGIGTGFNDNFDIRNIAQNADYLSPHSYAYFHGTSNIDPWLGQRTTYSANFITSWCEMLGKPVVVQEIGCSEDWLPPSKIGTYLRLNYLSTWADGAAGFVWWSSHNIDTTFRLKNKELVLPLSDPIFAQGKFNSLEYALGLLNTDNTPKSYASAYKKSIETVDKLGFGWNDNLPVCYIIVPSNQSFDKIMHHYIGSYVLAKQNHFDVKLCYEGAEIPTDAKAVIIPGQKLTGASKDIVQNYLENGGRVFQSFENDFGTAIQLKSETTIKNTDLIVFKSVGEMEGSQKIPLTFEMKFKKTTYLAPAQAIVTYENLYNQYNAPSEGALYSQPVGKGTFYYFSGKLEQSLSEIYNPWVNTSFDLIYSVLKPISDIEIDNKYVEFYHKTRAKESIIMLLNHSEKYQNLTIKSEKALKLENYENGSFIGNGNEIMLTLKPGEVLIAKLD